MTRCDEQTAAIDHGAKSRIVEHFPGGDFKNTPLSLICLGGPRSMVRNRWLAEKTSRQFSRIGLQEPSSVVLRYFTDGKCLISLYRDLDHYPHNPTQALDYSSQAFASGFKKPAARS